MVRDDGDSMALNRLHRCSEKKPSVFRALKALWQLLGSRGVNTTLIWEKIKDIVIKTVIA